MKAIVFITFSTAYLWYMQVSNKYYMDTGGDRLPGFETVVKYYPNIRDTVVALPIDSFVGNRIKKVKRYLTASDTIAIKTLSADWLVADTLKH